MGYHAGQKPGARWLFVGHSDTVIIFVHGVLSSSEECWTHPNGTYWPALVSQDPEFEEASVYLADYYSAVDSGRYDFAQCAREVWEHLRTDRNEGRTPMDYARVIFVAHSLGGVVIRRLLEENSPDFTRKQVGLVLIASPSGGSAYAKFFGFVARFYGHRAVMALKPDSEVLKDIDYRFRGLLEAKRIDLIGIEACENHGPLVSKRLKLRLPPIVSVESSSKYFGPPKIIQNTDHSSISKPEDKEHASYQFLKRFFLSKWARQSTRKSSGSARAQRSSNDVLFSVYSEAARPFCIVRDVDFTFKAHVGVKSVWVCGKSGVGKTTLVKRYLDEAALNPLQISLGHVQAFGDGRFSRELTETINSRRKNDAIKSYADLVKALAWEYGRGGVVLFVDEVPIGAIDLEEELKLLASISALVDSVQKEGGPDLHVVICSIEPPRIDAAPQKCREQIELVPVRAWTQKELGALVEMIKGALSIKDSSRAVESELVSAAAGSPRVVKEFYRRRLMMGAGNESETTSLRMVLHALGVGAGKR